MTESIVENLKIILERIESACHKSNRNPDEVRLLLATKTVSAENIKIAIKAGQTLIAAAKQGAVGELMIEKAVDF